MNGVSWHNRNNLGLNVVYRDNYQRLVVLMLVINLKKIIPTHTLQWENNSLGFY